jgi:hypothetical protein
MSAPKYYQPINKDYKPYNLSISDYLSRRVNAFHRGAFGLSDTGYYFEFEQEAHKEGAEQTERIKAETAQGLR